MTRIDQFESAFLAADKTRFRYTPISIESVLVVTDLEPYEARLFGGRLRKYLRVLGEEVRWHDGAGSECSSIGELLELVERTRPDLVCSYRNLHSGGWRWPFSLGEHLDVLTQVTTTPVLVLPRPDEFSALDAATVDTNSVMALTDHLAGDDRLVNYALRFTSEDGTLRLTHLEDGQLFERYMDAIARISTIETSSARHAILDRLLKEPREYIDSCRCAVLAAGLAQTIETEVALGGKVADYKALVAQHGIDLLVLNTKDNDQQAMHGRAYPLAVELRHTSLLML